MLDQALVEQLSKQADDILNAIEPIVQTWREQGPDAEAINEVFRGLHTIKGGFGFFGLRNIKTLAHALEDNLSGVRSMHFNLTPKHVELCISAFARLRELSLDPWSSDDEDLACLLKDLGYADEDDLSDENNDIETQWPLVPSHKQCEQAIELSREIYRITFITSRDIEDQGLTLLDMNDMLTALGNPLQVATGIDDIEGLSDCIGFDLSYQVLFMTTISVEDLAMTLDIPEHCIEKLDLQEFVKQDADDPQITIDGIEYLLRSIAQVSTELAERMDKQVDFAYEITDVSLSPVQRLGLQACLIHLLRNALDHGIESPEVRQLNGKDPTGLITLSAGIDQGQIKIKIRDNGAGINGQRVIDRALERKLIKPDAVPSTDSEIFGLLFLPGFSTCDQVSEISGRGVGMDVVKQQLHELGGDIVVQSTLGKGSTFVLTIPLQST